MAEQQPLEESDWQGVENTVSDEEEARVIFCSLDSFLQYGRVAHFNVTHMRRQAFYALPEAHWKMLAAPPFNYLETLDKVDAAIDHNAGLARTIVKYGLRSFQVIGPTEEDDFPVMPDRWVGVAKYGDIDKARSTIRQFYRDWSAEGAEEREACYGPIKQVLADERSKHPEIQHLKVLVPGAGLARLVFDLCLAGYETEGNEISYHQLLASSYILNNCRNAEQHTIYPWIHSFSNHLTRDHHLQGYKIPDVHPATALASAENAGAMSMCAADFLCLYTDEDHADTYDAVASVFFLDTAPNLIRYLQAIYHCLKPGGVLINIGPLLWHFEDRAPGNNGHDDDGNGEHDPNTTTGIADPGNFELSGDEVRALVEKLGFVVEKWESNIRTPYIQDPESMLQTVYYATSWVARKPAA
ncbi:hypothetical protein SLS53_000385 [Cytospora paraplurivora]|uniref:carnosine N-methyltransferase n=1 Tax=Cytospora paraplurivora TaxID=2898453 RepID=A0AAN9UKQ1_9PEZI